MAWNQAPQKFGAGNLGSGTSSNPIVRTPKQMVAIELSEKDKAAGSSEFASINSPTISAFRKKRKGSNNGFSSQQ